MLRQWLGAARMRKALFLAFFPAFFVKLAITSIANAKGPCGNIHVGQWKGGAFTDDNTGAFSHCSASSSTAMASFWWSG
jgi:hypothetical protein